MIEIVLQLSNSPRRHLDQLIAADDLVSIQQQIKINNPWFPFFAPLSPKLALDFQQTMEQRMRAQCGANLRGRIEKCRRILRTANSGIIQER